jgi:hypothetical protein
MMYWNIKEVFYVARKTTQSSYTMRMDPQLRQRAEQAAADDHRHLSSLIQHLLHQHCADREPRAEDSQKRGRK